MTLTLVSLATLIFWIGYGINHFWGNKFLGHIVAISALFVGFGILFGV